MKRTGPGTASLLLLLLPALGTPGGCTARRAGGEGVTIVRSRDKVRDCVDIAGVMTELEGEAGLSDLRQKTADLGGNCLLVFNAHSGGAFYCKKPPPIEPPSGLGPEPTREPVIPRPPDATRVPLLPTPGSP